MFKHIISNWSLLGKPRILLVEHVSRSILHVEPICKTKKISCLTRYISRGTYLWNLYGTKVDPNNNNVRHLWNICTSLWYLMDKDKPMYIKNRPQSSELCTARHGSKEPRTELFMFNHFSSKDVLELFFYRRNAGKGWVNWVWVNNLAN